MFWGFLHVAVYISSSFCKFAQYIPLCGYTTRYLSIHLSKDMKFVSIFWLLQIKHLWIFMYKSLYEKVLFFSLSKYLGVQWLSCIVDMFNFLKNSQNVLLSGVIIYIPTTSFWEFHLLSILFNTWNDGQSFNFSYSGVYVMRSHFGINFHFHDN